MTTAVATCCEFHNADCTPYNNPCCYACPTIDAAQDLMAPADDLDDGLLDDQAADEPANLYPDVYTFVAEFLAPTYAHEVSDQNTSWRWCARWWAHVEAVARLEACWKAFEVLRLDPGTGASVWFRDHADPCMAVLTAPNGPFARCSDVTHKLPRDLPLTLPPAGLTQRS